MPVRTLPITLVAVVAADFYGQYSLVDLGLVPVGISGGVPSNEPYASALADVPVVGDHAAASAERHAGTKWATFSPADAGQWFLLSPAWTDDAVLADAGVRFADAVVELGETSEDYSAERSLEELPILADADVIVVPADASGAIDPFRQPFLDSPVWQALPAVVAGNVLAAPSGTSSLGMGEELLDTLDAIIPKVQPVAR